MRTRGIMLASLAALALGGCALDIVDTLAGSSPSEAAEGESGTGPLNGDDGDDDGGDEDGDGGQDEHGQTPIFDVGGEPSPVASCEFASQLPSHIGCEFYGLDLDGPGLADEDPFGFVVINPLSKPVEITLERHGERGWELVQAAMLDGEDELVLLPDDAEAHGTGVHDHASFRVAASAPVIVIQATPAAGVGVSASATMLQPTAAWASVNPIAGWRTHQGVGEPSFLAVVAPTPGTTVAITPMFDIADAPPAWANDWNGLQLLLSVEPGQVLRLDAGAIDAAEVDHGTSGSTVASGQEHLVSVFSAHTCAAIPDYEGACGHMQEHLSPRLVGTQFVAPRLVAAGPVHERTMFQVVATEPNTEVVFSYFDGQAGVELDSVVIDPDEPYAVYESAHDLAIRSDRPILAAAYMTNPQTTVGLGSLGSPSMVQLAPVDQWSRHHWVWVPEGFETHLLVGSELGADVEVEWISGLAGDEQPQPQPPLLELGEVAAIGLEPRLLRRYAVGPGIHKVSSSAPATVVVAGWRPGDGFAYLGGWGPSLADLGPEG